MGKSTIKYTAKKIIKKIGMVLALSIVAVVLAVMSWPAHLEISSYGSLSLSVIMNQARAAELSDWTIKFNPTGTQVKDKQLYILLDFYPSPKSLCYPMFHLYLPVIPPDAKPEERADPKYRESLPHEWVLCTPLSVFVKVPSSITTSELGNWIANNYDADVMATIDRALAQADSSHAISPYLRNRTTLGLSNILANKEAVITATNTRLADYSVTGTTIGSAHSVQSGSIDMGAHQVGTQTVITDAPNGRVFIDTENPANDTGTIDTFQVTLVSWGNNADNCVCGSMISDGGDDYTPHDSYSLGTVTVNGGAEHTYTGISFAVDSGEYLGFYGEGSGSNTYLIITTSNSTGMELSSMAGWPAGQVTYSPQSEWGSSCYATGVESGGTPSLTNTPTSKDLGTQFPDGRAVYAKGTAPNNPVQTGDCTFTIVNDGAITENITISGTNPTPGWTLAGATGADQCKVTAYYVGQNPASGVVLTTSAQAFYNGLAASANISWDFKFEMPTSSTNTTERTMTIQLTAITP